LPQLTSAQVWWLRQRRVESFASLLPQFQGSKYEQAALALTKLQTLTASKVVTSESFLTIGDEAADLGGSDETTKEQLHAFLKMMRPWKKGPLRLFGVDIDTEWRSDWKWDRIKPHIGCSLRGKAVADIGCANGYFMFRMLEENPRVVVGVDPNLKAWLEFVALKKWAGEAAKRLHFEVLDANELLFPNCFDVVFCLGVLYHTTDPVGMLRNLWKSMTPNATLIVDCQGIPDDDGDDGDDDTQAAAGGGQQPLCLVPRRAYAKAGGIWFLPNKLALTYWLERANFRNITIFYSEKLSVEEQRSTEGWADLSSLESALDPTNPERTIEGYPAPHRFYVRATRG